MCRAGERIVALGRWVRPARVEGGTASDGYGGPAAGQDAVERWPAFGEGFDAALCGAFFGAMAEHRERLMGGRRHYCECLTLLEWLWRGVVLHDTPEVLKRRKWIGRIPTDNLDMELLGTDASYTDRGAASMILQYGCDRADEEGVECYVDSSPRALKLYQKFGWVKKAEREMPQVDDFRYTEHFLVRPARDRS